MHHVLPISANSVPFSALRPSLLHHKSDGFHTFYFKTDDNVIMRMLLQIFLISNKRGCSIEVGS